MTKFNLTYHLLFLTTVFFFLAHASIQGQALPKTKSIRIIFRDYSIEAELFDTETAKAVYDALPFEAYARTWGEEIYFEVPVKVKLEKGAKAGVNVGDLAYWPDGPAFCIFLDPRPQPTGRNPLRPLR